MRLGDVDGDGFVVCRSARAERLRDSADAQRRRSLRTRAATCATSPPISRGSSIGRRLCAHRLSARRPSRTSAGRARSTSAGVLRSPRASPCARAQPSVNARAGRWQVAHAIAAVATARGRRTAARRSAIAAALPDTRLDGSIARGGGHGPSARMRRISRVGERDQRARLRARRAPAATRSATRRTRDLSFAARSRSCIRSVVLAGDDIERDLPAAGHVEQHAFRTIAPADRRDDGRP